MLYRVVVNMVIPTLQMRDPILWRSEKKLEGSTTSAATHALTFPSLFDFPKHIFTATHNTAPHCRLQAVPHVSGGWISALLLSFCWQRSNELKQQHAVPRAAWTLLMPMNK